MKIRYINNKRGQGLAEYSLILSLIAISTVASLSLVSQALDIHFTSSVQVFAGDNRAGGVNGDGPGFGGGRPGARPQGGPAGIAGLIRK